MDSAVDVLHGPIMNKASTYMYTHQSADISSLSAGGKRGTIDPDQCHHATLFLVSRIVVSIPVFCFGGRVSQHDGVVVCGCCSLYILCLAGWMDGRE